MTAAREALVAAGEARWQRLAELLEHGQPQTGEDVAELAAAYRDVAADLAFARSHAMPEDVLRYLSGLCAEAHDRLHGRRERGAWHPVAFIASEVPAAVRRQAVFLGLASLLFWGPFLFSGWAGWHSAAYADAVLGPAEVVALEASWAAGPGRDAATDASMTGFYVFNNAGIALRTFAMGGLLGLGAVYVLVWNGVVLGTAFGVVAGTPGWGNFVEFTCGHGSWELTAITLAGAAGLKLGWTILAPGRRTRAEALSAASGDLARMVVGFTVMLLVAALIEGLWSASPVPRPIKWAFGLSQWVVVGLWLWRGGRVT